jgi:hypothetical protein
MPRKPNRRDYPCKKQKSSIGLRHYTIAIGRTFACKIDEAVTML